jgi:hypothetical protein
VTLADARAGMRALVGGGAAAAPRLDYLRFLDPRYERTRTCRRARPRAALDRPAVESSFGAGRSAGAALARRGLPGAHQSEAFIRAAARSGADDATVDIGRRSSIPSPPPGGSACTVLPVGSWDHLSSKAVLRAVDRVVV